MQSEEVVVSAFYKFISIPSEHLAQIQARLESFADSRGLRGLVVLGSEGINATVAGEHATIADLRALLAELLPNEELTFKDSRATKAPFARFKVDIRPEIITTYDPSLSSEESQGTHLSPEQWHTMISSDPDVVVVDTRNDYETEIGVFEGAIDPKIKKFSDFRWYVEQHGLPKDKKLLLYCTGGIRCEKAVPEVKRLGYDTVYQLEGGILKYLEAYPNGHFKGECFVFDHRVAVDGNLEPSKVYKLCPHCGNPGREAIECVQCGTASVVCHRCVERDDRRTCSKNCAHHARLRAGR
jgi:UPF0176 protein